VDEGGGAREVGAGLEAFEGGVAFGGGAAAEEDVVGAFGEELGGELEADACVSWSRKGSC